MNDQDPPADFDASTDVDVDDAGSVRPVRQEPPDRLARLHERGLL